ncbi:cytochrome-c peroxidase [Sulfurimonas sp. SAG-AH-194-C20]|nr:cytochrome-c peroxidase [Sulfurimonas sp. SAG-AH-194-C20]MDF1879357.1 cytochrome-c peroxidase [Sulfurimonas sp. SAG-AH-194-C20]
MLKQIILGVVSSTVIMASSLVSEAKNAGLSAIPSDKQELMKLIDDKRNPITAEKTQLGKMLYFEPRLSKSGLISCNTCHNLATGGDDGLAAAVGHKWTVNPHHLGSPTVYNAVFFDVQFWDGRAPNLEAQAGGPILAAPEMANTAPNVVAVVTSIPEYVEKFQIAYGKDVKITYKLIADTIGNFERTLVTPSAFDDYLNGQENALSQAEKAGMKKFIEVGCATCHTGIALGGSMNMLGVTAKYKYTNVGDFKGDANGMVKVPTLRNITQTAPYFHNGQVTTLKEAIVEMGRIQLGTSISDADATSIELFLHTLDGRKPKIIYPILATRTASTPVQNVH